MGVLVLKLSGVLQSWGTTLKLNNHDTDDIPSKSGVLGMIASAQGRKRDEGISDLASLRFGVRVDAPGKRLRDFQVNIVGGSFGRKIASNEMKVSTRYYLQDACFVCGLEGEKAILEGISYDLRHPANALFLGRRSCPADPGILIGIFDGSLDAVLKDTECIPCQAVEGQVGWHPRIVIDAMDAGDRMVHDVPVSYDFRNRQYSYRMVKEI